MKFELNPEEKNKSEIEESLNDAFEVELRDEEDMLLDAMEDYKIEYNVKTVNTKSQKFKRFLYKWKQENQ